jgi:hypothetical protein
VDYQGKSLRVVRNGVGIVSEIPGRYAQSIFNQVFEFGVGVTLLERTPLGNYAVVVSNARMIPRSPGDSANHQSLASELVSRDERFTPNHGNFNSAENVKQGDNISRSF